MVQGPIFSSRRITSSLPISRRKVLTASGYGRITTEVLPSEGREFYAAEGYHQQYLSSSKNPGGYCGLGGTGVKLSTPFETNWGPSCPTGVVPAPETTEK